MIDRFNYLLGKLPVIDLKVVYKGKVLSLAALIDTGADYTIFSRAIARKLGINVEEGEMKVLEGAGGSIVAYIHQVNIILCNKEIGIKACFSEKEDVPENILGRKDVINHFKLILDKERFELVPHEEN